MHRADFHGVLETVARAAAPNAIRLNAKVAAIEQTDGGVRAVLTSGEVIEGDVLIGCDPDGDFELLPAGSSFPPFFPLMFPIFFFSTTL